MDEVIQGTKDWIDHILVDTEFRNKGIEYSNVKELLNRLKVYFLKSNMLIASEMGKSLPQKAGFKVVLDCACIQREVPWNYL